MSDRAIRYIEAGEREPSVDAIQKIAAALGLSLIHILRVLKVLQKLVVFQGTVCAGAVGWQRSLHLKPVGIEFIEADWFQHIII